MVVYIGGRKLKKLNKKDDFLWWERKKEVKVYYALP